MSDTLALRYETKHTYTGESDGVRRLINGYYEYGEEINTARSFPDIRDGLKVVQRRTAYAFMNDPIYFKKNSSVKSSHIIGAASKLHPHGDGSIYDVVARMVESSGHSQLSLLRGIGNWGSRIAGESQAAFRYTEITASEWARELRGQVIDCVPMVEGENMDGTKEPEFLSIPYPLVLINESQGMGLGISSRIASYNFNEVVELTKKYIKTGSFDVTKDILYPDFTTGGLVVADNATAARIMVKGVGSYRVRARVGIEGNVIKVFEIPAGTTLMAMKGKLKKILENDEVPNIKDYQDAQGYVKKGSVDNSVLNIYCKRGTAENVLMELYSRNILENNYPVYMLANVGKKVIVGGVYTFIKRWVELRSNFLVERTQLSIEALEDEHNQLKLFLNLVDDPEAKETFLDKLTTVGKSEARSYLTELYPGITDESQKWICSRSAESFLDGGSYRNRFQSVNATITQYKEDLQNDKNLLVLRELEEVSQNHKGYHERKTQLTNTAYQFKKLKAMGGTKANRKLVDDALTYYVFTSNGFIYKSRNDIAEKPGELLRTRVPANTVFVGFDNNGSFLRVYGEDLEYNDHGTYFYKYAGIAPDENINPMYWCVDDGKPRHILLKSSNMMVFDPNNHVTKRKINFQQHKVNLAVESEGIAHIFEPGTLPKYMMAIDLYQRGRREINRISILDTSTLRDAKSSQTKISAFGGSVNLVGWVDLTEGWFENVSWLADEYLRHRFVGKPAFKQLPGYAEITDALTEGFDLMDVLNIVE